ncbi:MAG: oligosaccharide flippase family protein [Bacteroidota bacterium]|nr:oligosaccharide flippase family protein [Bacteroidota bacterium]
MLYITAGNFIEMLRFGITRTAIIRFLSGAEDEERRRLIGSNWMISFVVTILIVLILWAVYLLFPQSIDNSGYSLFFIWYPVLAFLNLPFNNGLSVLQADQKFDKILFIRLINVGVFAVFLAVNLFFLGLGLIEILYVHLGVNLLTSLISLLLKWDGLRYFFHGNKASRKTLLDFGKYTTGTLIGSNLLKSSDTFIIGLSPFLGTVGVAFYSVPLKLTEILEIPLRSFVATAFPKMSKASIQNKIEEVKKIFYSYSGGLTYMLLPIIIAGLIFAEEFVIIIGGKEYIETASIFRIFCIYGLFLPIDKFTGVALDSINRPRKNFFKVLYMASANIIGDTVVIFMVSRFLLGTAMLSLFFSNAEISLIPDIGNAYAFITTLELVAVVTIFFTIIGIVVGLNYLNAEIGIQKKRIFTDGLTFFTRTLESLLGRSLIRKY